MAAGVSVASLPTASAAPARPSAPKAVVLYYHFVNYAADRCLAVSGASTRNNTAAIVTTCGEKPPEPKDQIWSATLQNAQHYNIFENLDRKCLDIYRASRSVGAHAVIYTCNGHTDQQWHVITIRQFPNVYEFQNRNSGLCLTGTRGLFVNGAVNIQSRCVRSNTHQWWFPQR